MNWKPLSYQPIKTMPNAALWVSREVEAEEGNYIEGNSRYSSSIVTCWLEKNVLSIIVSVFMLQDALAVVPDTLWAASCFHFSFSFFANTGELHWMTKCGLCSPRVPVIIWMEIRDFLDITHFLKQHLLFSTRSDFFMTCSRVN